MIKTEPWYVCNTCERVVGQGWQHRVTPEMEKAETHFCNNNCKDLYKGDTTNSWVSINWPIRVVYRRENTL